MDTLTLYVAPLCPAGHLPHTGGDQPAALLQQIANIAGLVESEVTANLPPRGGDVRQDRGGREGALSLPNSIRKEFRA